jgi:hypothetical protein
LAEDEIDVPSHVEGRPVTQDSRSARWLTTTVIAVVWLAAVAIPMANAQTVQTKRVMQQKLAETQQLRMVSANPEYV